MFDDLHVHLKQYNRRLKLYQNGDVQHRIYFSTIVSSIDKESNPDNEGRKSVIECEGGEFSNSNLSRSRNLLIDYAKANCNCWSSFITLTFRDEITDLHVAVKKFSNWRDSINRYCRKNNLEPFKYLGVPEFQKNGRVHYHLLTNLKCNSYFIPKRPLKDLWNPSSKLWTQLEYYDIRFWSYGYSSAFDLRLTDDKFNVAKYIIKYLYKDIDKRLLGHTKVLKSNNLNKPKLVKLMDSDSRYIDFINHVDEKKYDTESVYTIYPTIDNPDIIPSTTIELTSREHDNILFDLMQNNY